MADTIYVNIGISGAADLSGLALNLNYNNSVVEPHLTGSDITVTKGTFLNGGDSSADMISTNTVDNNTIYIAHSLFNSETPVSGTDTMFTVQFDVIGSGSANFTMSNTLVEGSAGTATLSQNVMAAIDETVQFSESPTRLSSFFKVISDTVQWSEALIRNSAIAKVVSNTVQWSENTVRLSAINRIISNTLQLTEATVRLSVVNRIISDTVQWSEALVRTSAITKIANNTVQWVDGTVRLSAITKLVNETVQWAEYLVRPLETALLRVINETVQLSESLVRLSASTRLISDTVNLVEDTVYRRGIKRIVDNTVQWSESTLRLSSITQLINNIVQWSEVTVRLSAITRIVNDTFQWVESIVRPAEDAVIRVINETVQLSEALVRSTASTRIVSDTVQFVEATIKKVDIIRIISDTVNWIDQIIRPGSLIQVINDTVNWVESTTRLSAITKLISDTLNIVDVKLNSDILFYWSCDDDNVELCSNPYFYDPSALEEHEYSSSNYGNKVSFNSSGYFRNDAIVQPYRGRVAFRAYLRYGYMDSDCFFNQRYDASGNEFRVMVFESNGDIIFYIITGSASAFFTLPSEYNETTVNIEISWDFIEGGLGTINTWINGSLINSTETTCSAGLSLWEELYIGNLCPDNYSGTSSTQVGNGIDEIYISSDPDTAIYDNLLNKKTVRLTSMLRLISDTIQWAEETVRRLSSIKIINSTINFVENLVKVGNIRRVVSDTVNLVEAQISFTGPVQVINDTVNWIEETANAFAAGFGEIINAAVSIAYSMKSVTITYARRTLNIFK